VVDDALGDEVRVTVVAAGFDKLAAAPAHNQFESRLSRLLEEPSRTATSEPERPPLILEDDDHDVFGDTPEPVSFDAEEDLDIPDFLKS